MTKVRKRFWWARLAFIAAQVPLIIWLELRHPDWLVHYLVWMSWATWMSTELPLDR